MNKEIIGKKGFCQFVTETGWKRKDRKTKGLNINAYGIFLERTNLYLYNYKKGEHSPNFHYLHNLPDSHYNNKI